MPHDTNGVPRIAYGPRVADPIKLLRAFDREIRKLDEGAMWRDLAGGDRLPPDLACLLPRKAAEREGRDGECPVGDAGGEVHAAKVVVTAWFVLGHPRWNLVVAGWLRVFSSLESGLQYCFTA